MKIGSIDKIPEFIQSVKDGDGRLMGFGHRVYKTYDPRARIMKKMCDKVLDELHISDPLLDIAKQLEDHGLTQAKGFDNSSIAILVNRLSSLENTLSNMKAKLAAIELDGKAKQKVST